ncbi:MAG: hypothetical protein IJS65_00635 [Clostridia bacterium]|nr:hypothetical protein [Clostridia bacterium]
MNSENYYPNKLMLATIIALVSFFSSVFGFIPGIVALKMANELPENYNTTDVKRAKGFATAAIVIAIIEVVVGVPLLITLLNQ